MWNIEFCSVLPLLQEKVLNVEVDLEGYEWKISSSPRQPEKGHNSSNVRLWNFLWSLFLRLEEQTCPRDRIHV